MGEPALLLQLCLAVGLAIGISAMCSVFEAVLYSLPLSHVEILRKKNPKSGAILFNLKRDIHKPITAILTLNTIANTAGAAIAGASAAMIFGDENMIWFSAAFTLSILLFSEIMPKTLGVAYSKSLAQLITYPLHWLVKLMGPTTWLIQGLTQMISKKGTELLVSAEEIQALASHGRRSGAIDMDEERVINNILNLKGSMVRDVMTPNTVTFSLEANLTVAEAIKEKDKWDLHSRAPVYDTDQDNVIGMVLRKDVLLCFADNNKDTILKDLMHAVHFVPESAQLNRVMLEFFDKRKHLFVVVDEYGTVTGVISLEDIIEEIVGHEIMDESDQTKDMRELAKRKRISLLGQLGKLKDDRQVED